MDALRTTVDDLKWPETFGVQPIPPPDQITPDLRENEEFLQNLFNICCTRHITEGVLKCPNCGREYGIKNGIANMLLNEDEI